MTVVLTGIDETKRRKANYLDGFNEESMLSLKEYISTAEKCIARFASNSMSRSMLMNEDAVSFVAEHIMYGTARWKSDGGRSFSSYLIQCARWAITRWVGKQMIANANPIYSLNNSTCKGRGVDDDTDFYNLIADQRDMSNSSDIYWEEINNRVEELVSSPVLTERQSECLRFRYLHDRTFKEVGEHMGISKQAAQMHVNAAMEKLRDFHCDKN